jgi:hypothetical protein
MKSARSPVSECYYEHVCITFLMFEISLVRASVLIHSLEDLVWHAYYTSIFFVSIGCLQVKCTCHFCMPFNLEIIYIGELWMLKNSCCASEHKRITQAYWFFGGRNLVHIAWKYKGPWNPSFYLISMISIWFALNLRNDIWC